MAGLSRCCFPIGNTVRFRWRIGMSDTSKAIIEINYYPDGRLQFGSMAELRKWFDSEYATNLRILGALQGGLLRWHSGGASKIQNYFEKIRGRLPSLDKWNPEDDIAEFFDKIYLEHRIPILHDPDGTYSEIGEFLFRGLDAQASIPTQTLGRWIGFVMYSNPSLGVMEGANTPTAMGVNIAIGYSHAVNLGLLPIAIAESWQKAISNVGEALSKLKLAEADFDRRKKQADEDFKVSTDTLRGNLLAKVDAFQSRVDECKAEFDKIKDLAEEHSKNMKERFGLLIASSEQLVSNAMGSLQAKMQDYDAEIKRIQDLYHTKFSISAPVEYWKELENSSKNQFKWCTISLAVWIVASILVLICTIKSFDYSAPIIPGNVSAWSQIKPWQITMTATLIAIIFVVARLIIRIQFSSLHLQRDAKHRVVMIQAFLALLEKDRVKSDQDINLIIQCLFRPIATGLMKEDAIPPSMVELVTRITQAKQQ